MTVSNPAMKIKRTQVGLLLILVTIASIVKGLESAKWDEFKNCSIQTVCSDEIKSCQGEVKWGNLKEKLSDAQILFVIDQPRGVQKALPYGDGIPFDLDHFKRKVCDLTLVKWTDRECTMFHTPNRCPWTTIQPTDLVCTWMEIDAAESGDFPASCTNGPGWQGTLDLSFSDGFYFLNWTTLVKQPKCVFGVTLTDNSTDTEKFFWTTFSDVNIPIQYQKEICSLVIRLDYQILEMARCLMVKTKNKCTASEYKSRNIPNNSNHVNSRRRLQIIIIYATVVISVIAISVTTVVFTIRKTKGKRKEKDDHTWAELGQGNFGTVYKGTLRQVVD